ncbi:precorrin-6A synthase (deacetylating) [Rhodoplanes sp. Z2-YC6860]|uniref:precorrin-6A synthase (deacetylating) n=1 Tax=Rhodoplanes sp. Z2-YC6860 TaxID=674703 RepID=UPI00078B5E66|nr:precorrin-6A synthase (deacetylating) [Rhodoplanes sp. Z2-YC6860]AMN43898.1 precorrin 6A synthase [Rhodoplanes sp. Z2-YC6860]
MRKLSIIGIGAGNPDYITVQAIKALETLDVVFLIDKGENKDDLAKLRRELCDRYIKKPFRAVEAKDAARDRKPTSYETAVTTWHDKRAAIYEAMIRDELADNQHGAFLVWGDPSLYDSTLRIVDQVAAMKTVTFKLDVIPGITAVQALAAQHQIALNRIGGPIHVTTGRQLANGLPGDDTVVMLDGECTFKTVKESNVDIYWGAYLGTPDEILISGSLGERAPEIERVRSEARARHGWIMDTYLLRRT